MALSAIVPTGKLKVAGSLLINVAKEVIDYSPEHNVVLDTNIGEVVKDAAINTAIDIGVDKVSKIASEYAQSAKKEVEQAVKEASHKQNISRNRPNSTKRREAAILATENLQVARDKEVAVQLINETTEFTTPTMKQALQQWHDNSNKQ